MKQPTAKTNESMENVNDKW